MREKRIRSHVCLAWILMMTTPYQHNPDSSAPQVMSPSITLGGQTGGDMAAAQVPNYGGVDTGGAGGPAPEGGSGGNRTMAEGQLLPNGVVGSQNPISPGGRAATTGSDGFEQPRGSGLPPRTSSSTSSRPRVEPTAVAGAVNVGRRMEVTTGSARTATTGSGSNAGQRVDATTPPAQDAAIWYGCTAAHGCNNWIGSGRYNRIWRDRHVTTAGCGHWVICRSFYRTGRERTEVSG